MFKILILAIGWLLSLPSYAYDYYDNLYPECDDKSKEVTSRMVRAARSYCTPSGYDWPACLFKSNQHDSLARCDDYVLKTPSLIENIIMTDKVDKDYYSSQSDTNNIHPSCFFASASLGLNQWNPDTGNYRYYQCGDTLEPQDTGRPPCSNQEYVHTVAKAFNEVANCLKFNMKEKTMAFGLTHHESRFLNNKAEESGEKHRCFGQINNDFVATLNQYIVGNSPHHTKYKNIYNEAITRCPFLKKSITPHPYLIHKSNHKPPAEVKNCEQKCVGSEDILQQCEDECEKTDFKKGHEKHSSSIICKTSEDPYSCSFYMMYNMRVTEERLKQFLKTPLKESQMKPNIMKIGEEDFKIFNDKDFLFKWAFLYWVHNAGFRGIVRDGFTNFIEVLKKTMNYYSQKCEKCLDTKKRKECRVCNQYASYKESILKGQPLSGKILVKEFQKYASDPKHEVSNQDQVRDIINNIQKDLRAFAGEGALLADAMKSLPKKQNSTQNGIRRASLDEFLEDVKYQCPTQFPFSK